MVITMHFIVLNFALWSLGIFQCWIFKTLGEGLAVAKHTSMIYSKKHLAMARRSSMDHLKNTWRPLGALNHYNKKCLVAIRGISVIYSKEAWCLTREVSERENFNYWFDFEFIWLKLFSIRLWIEKQVSMMSTWCSLSGWFSIKKKLDI